MLIKSEGGIIFEAPCQEAMDSWTHDVLICGNSNDGSFQYRIYGYMAEHVVATLTGFTLWSEKK